MCADQSTGGKRPLGAAHKAQESLPLGDSSDTRYHTIGVTVTANTLLVLP